MGPDGTSRSCCTLTRPSPPMYPRVGAGHLAGIQNSLARLTTHRSPITTGPSCAQNQNLQSKSFGASLSNPTLTGCGSVESLALETSSCRGAPGSQPCTVVKYAASGRTPCATSSSRKALRPGRPRSPTRHARHEGDRSASTQRLASATDVERRYSKSAATVKSASGSTALWSVMSNCAVAGGTRPFLTADSRSRSSGSSR